MAAGFYSPRQIAGAMVRVGATKADLLHFSRWFEEAAMEAEMEMEDAKNKFGSRIWPSHELLQRKQDIRLLADLSEALEDKT